jgi:hypothetical protein
MNAAKEKSEGNMPLSLVPEIVAMGLDQADIERLGVGITATQAQLEAFRLGKAERSDEAINPYARAELRELREYDVGARAVTMKLAKGAEQ